MAASVGLNYVPTTNSAGTFNVQSTGYVQGTFLDDPASRNWLLGGVLASSETLPMWGGVAISESVLPNIGTNPSVSELGDMITRAVTLSSTGATNALTGFSVYNQNYAAVITPQSSVPLTPSYGLVEFFRLGSNARIVVAASAALASLDGGAVSQQVSWDFVGQQLIPYQAAYASASVASATYTTATGVLAVTFGSAPAGTTPTVGATFSLSGLTTSAGSAALVNGNFTLASSGGSGTVLNFNIGAGLGTITINNSTGTLAAGGGAVPVRVLEVAVGGSLTVNYNSSTNVANWNYSGTVAVIQL